MRKSYRDSVVGNSKNGIEDTEDVDDEGNVLDDDMVEKGGETCLG